MHHELHTEIDIDAPSEVVWDILTDLDHYGDWNPFIVSSVGEVAVGQRLTNRLQTPGGMGMTLKPTVTEVDAGQTYEWLGRLGLPGVFDGRHRFDLIENRDGGTRFIHSEQLDGALVRFMRNWLDTKTKGGFEAMNSALKARAEEFAGSAS